LFRQRLDGVFLLLLRRQIERPVAVDGERQQGGEQRRDLGHVVGRLRQQRLQLVEFGVGGIAARETGGAF